VVAEYDRAAGPRRALPSAEAPQKDSRPTNAVSAKQWRRGLALGAAAAIGITTIGIFGLSNGPTAGFAFANQAGAPAGIDEARQDVPSRTDERPTLEDLVKQRSEQIALTGEQIEAKRDQDAVASRNSLLEDTADAVEEEADRLRNLAIFLWPTKGGVGSPWGQRLHPILHYYRLHGGADIGGRCGQPIYAAQSGKVTKAATGGYNGGSGNNVRIDHGDINGIHVETAYLHMTDVEVSEGQQVAKGDLLGTVGSTGLSTACHLHLSLYKDGVNSDPLEYVKKSDADTDSDAKEDENSADRELGDVDAQAGELPT